MGSITFLQLYVSSGKPWSSRTQGRSRVSSPRAKPASSMCILRPLMSFTKREHMPGEERSFQGQPFRSCSYPFDSAARKLRKSRGRQKERKLVKQNAVHERNEAIPQLATRAAGMAAMPGKQINVPDVEDIAGGVASLFQHPASAWSGNAWLKRAASVSISPAIPEPAPCGPPARRRFPSPGA